MPPKKILSTSLNKVPEGYTMSFTHDGRPYLTPQSLLPDLMYAFAAHRSKMELDVQSKLPKFAQFEDIEQDNLVGDLYDHPSDPLLSPRERLALHAEVKALQAELGISYKDASHRLYMAEVRKLAMADKDAKAWANLAASVKHTLKNIQDKNAEKDQKMAEEEDEEEEEGNREGGPSRRDD